MTVNSERRFCAVSVLAAVLLLIGVIFEISYQRKRTNELVTRYRYECPMHLLDLWGISTALSKEKGRFPRDMAEMNQKIPLLSKSRIPIRLSPVLCPASEVPFKEGDSITNGFDYVYVDWSGTFERVQDIPAEYPLAYDRRLANHLRKGIYVLKVNGAVFWDADASWIQQFSKTNHHIQIPIPQ
jgi:hypothetical protein